MSKFLKFADSKIYFAILFFLIMPINGAIIVNGNPFLGIILMALQTPRFINFTNKLWK